MPRFPVLLLVLLAVLGLPASSSAQAALGKVYSDIADDGALEPCDYSDAELADAERSIPADVDQYSPELRAAISDAKAARARGECEATPRPRTEREPAGPEPGGGSAGPAAPVEERSDVTESSAPVAPAPRRRAAARRSQPGRIRVQAAAPPAPPVGRSLTATGVASSAGELPTGEGAGAPAALVVLGLTAAALVLLYAALTLVRRRPRP